MVFSSFINTTETTIGSSGVWEEGEYGRGRYSESFKEQQKYKLVDYKTGIPNAEYGRMLDVTVGKFGRRMFANEKKREKNRRRRASTKHVEICIRKPGRGNGSDLGQLTHPLVPTLFL